MSVKRLWVGTIFCLFAYTGRAQVWDRMCCDSIRIDTTDTRTLKAEINAMAFFRDNEFKRVSKGYTLPGAWIQPKLTYNPIEEIHLELGAHLLLFDGANKYPNYAYHDIATWKGEQYQHGVHALPFFRAQADLKHLTVVLGDIYGAQNHRLITPMFNPEQNLSADPEMGFQLLLDRKHIHLDTWMNWQSYIFKEDSHQEAFTVGTNATLLWSEPNKRIRWSTPIQLLIQHRGGEQDTTTLGVQTLCNASVGMRMDYTPRRPNITSLDAQCNLLGSYQEKGHLWPFNTGWAIHGAIGMTMKNGLALNAGYFAAPKQYANLYGTPLMGTLSAKNIGETYNYVHTTYLNANYTYSFSNAYYLGAEVEVYDTKTPGHNDLNLSFGIFLRVNPSFVIKRWK